MTTTGRPLLRPGGDDYGHEPPALDRYKATDKLSLGASVNAMYGIFKNQVASTSRTRSGRAFRADSPSEPTHS